MTWRHHGRQHKQTYATLKQALQAKALRRLGATDPGDPGRLLFANYARDWIEHYGGYTYRGITESTRADYRLSLERHIGVPPFSRTRVVR